MSTLVLFILSVFLFSCGEESSAPSTESSETVNSSSVFSSSSEENQTESSSSEYVSSEMSSSTFILNKNRGCYRKLPSSEIEFCTEIQSGGGVQTGFDEITCAKNFDEDYVELVEYCPLDVDPVVTCIIKSEVGSDAESKVITHYYTLPQGLAPTSMCSGGEAILYGSSSSEVVVEMLGNGCSIPTGTSSICMTIGVDFDANTCTGEVVAQCPENPSFTCGDSATGFQYYYGALFDGQKDSYCP